MRIKRDILLCVAFTAYVAINFVKDYEFDNANKLIKKEKTMKKREEKIRKKLKEKFVTCRVGQNASGDHFRYKIQDAMDL